MVWKEKRKRDENKDTSFFFGGRQWDSGHAESTVSRVKGSLVDENSDGKYKT
jgi:hypothetical protein